MNLTIPANPGSGFFGARPEGFGKFCHMAVAPIRTRTVAACALVLAVTGAAGLLYATNLDPPHETFCTLGLPYIQGADLSFTFEDGGSPGPGECDRSTVMPDAHVLGFDCKLRDPDGKVVAELEANQPNGSCGLPMDGSFSVPGSWRAV